MVDSGKEILDRDSKIADFCAYLDIVRRHRQDFAVGDVSFVAIPDRSGDDYNRAYQRGADIQLKAIRDDAQKLSDGASAGQAQLDLIRQTDKLQDYWDSSEAANAAWDDYQHNSSRLEQDLGKLRESSAAVKGVADRIEQVLTLKQQQTTSVIKSLIEGTLRNSPGDLENRLVTGAASIWARNQGGGIGGLGTNQHLYAHHGAPGDNWNWNDVKADLQNSVADAFAAACKQLDAINTATDKNLQESYAKLLEALNIPQGPAGTGSGVTQPGAEGDLTPDQLLAIMNSQGHNLSREKAAEYAPLLEAAMKERGITSPAQKAAFLAQLAAETGGLTNWSENTPASGYNVGRGPIQLTGEGNYEAAGNALGIDLINNPGLASDPRYAFRIAAWFVTSDEMGNAMGKLGDGGWGSVPFLGTYATGSNGEQFAQYGSGTGFEGMSRTINGGMAGWRGRAEFYETARQVLGAPPLGPYPQHPEESHAG
jgi:predicted chitinase